MKKSGFLLMFFILLGIKSYGQFSFGVSPGISTNSAYFGYRIGKVVPYVGFQYANITFIGKETGEDFDSDLQEVVPYTDEFKFAGNLLVPNAGIKFFAIEKNNLKAYFNLSVAKPIINAKLEYNGEEQEEISDALKDLNLLGGEFGFGTEYFFDDNFSIGGEFGLRYLGGKFTTENTDSYYNEQTGTYEDTQIKNSFNLRTSPTYTKISLNFYFGGSN